ncbi:MAG TPA: aromatic ring-hydroxylating dioxygenase subunit alpha [Acidimicrobiales bacterium]
MVDLSERGGTASGDVTDDEALAGTRNLVAFPRQWWYPVAQSKDLGAKRPIAVELMERPLAVFRDATGHPRALLDRCPHRNLPLSLGRVHRHGDLECGYHGWRFDGTGSCTAIPGLASDGGSPASPARQVGAHHAIERHGFVWVWGVPADDPGGEPTSDPFPLPDVAAAHRTDRGSTGEVVFDYLLESTVHASLENALDVPHTAFLHKGIFRGGDPRDITATRREIAGGIEVQFVGEPVGLGPIRGKDGSQLTFDHWDRFFLPSIAQIEYGVRGFLHIVNTILHLPVAPRRTRAWFVVRYWTRLPSVVARPIVLARGKQIVRQDIKVLADQTERIARFGGERYASTELDLFGNGIWRLLRQAERAEEDAVGTPVALPPPRADTERTIILRI